MKYSLDWVPVQESDLSGTGVSLVDALSQSVDVADPDLRVFLDRFEQGRYGQPASSWRLVFDGDSPPPWVSHVLVFASPVHSGNGWQLVTLTEQIDRSWAALLNPGPVEPEAIGT